ncbi:MAG TPA: YfiR family protein [Gemmatimonadales bacterium]|nr:YfiR family protein [Gemmatimonadales bacterium]
MALIRDVLPQLVLWWLAATAPQPAPAQSSPAQSSPEYQLKAVFLFNFAQFVEWPSSTFPAPDTPLVIGVLGDDPFGPYLDDAIRGESVNGRPLLVRRYRDVRDIDTCHILFVSRREQGHLEQVLDSLKGRSILTVSDADRFASLGGMIRFVTDHNRIRLRINLEAAKAANLTLSSKLLRPAQIVTTGRD